MSGSSVRLGLIGCGRIAQVAHLPALEKADGIEPVVVCDQSEDVVRALAARYGIASYVTDAADVLKNDQVDAVLIAVPDRFHYSVTEAALLAGKHVLVEKPLTSTVDEARKLVELRAQTGLTLQVGATKRHDPGLSFARDFIASGQLGEARSFNAWYRIGSIRPGVEATLFPRTFVDEQVRGTEAGFKADRRRYLLATHGAHIFDTLRFLLGDVHSVLAVHREFGRDQAWSVLVTLNSGAVGTIGVAVDVPGDGAEGIEIFGSEGQLRVDTHFPFFRRASDVRAYSARESALTVPVFADTDPYERQVEAFARAVRGAQPANPNVVDGLEAVRLIEAVAKSAASGTAVEL
ncbi:Gfo/Idh/MocA family oxidoreductase [Actinospica sp.]|jgi:predicted dehydrogenase|uniref:Gfo/Idh/MocA family protein n=1 Tax=Actinospica sp. TaxID=1872142 RepID=UPI002B774B1F|nr:Gfo/Idh/MocA family oxidoreductase [Actinospica sp.]HWG24863.1 Gfo/Idh/MocA family oxidoreductase [Actinospica sp.]